MKTNTSNSSTMFNRREFIKTTGTLMAGAALGSRLEWALAAEDPPNIVFIFCDDMGYGDIGSFGSEIPTPNIDSIAREGVRFTHFSASPLCSPSRAGLMTGRYCTRVGVPRVLFSNSSGLDLSETTLAEVLKSKGYSTMCIGKWHLGDTEKYLPTSRGFDEYYGIPYSNDIPPVKLMHNTETIEYPVIQETLTKRYTEQALKFIERSREKRFFLYMPHTFPHTPLAVSEKFVDKSGMNLYADTVMEIDWSVGEILKALEKYGLEKNTLFIFTSDNGPVNAEGRSTGGLKGYKGSTWEGGVREPFVAKLPGKIPAGSECRGIAATIDMLPTLANVAGAKLPSKPLDGVDIWPLLTGEKKNVEREVLLYWEGWSLTNARMGKWKVRFAHGSLGMGMGGKNPPMGEGMPMGEQRGSGRFPGALEGGEQAPGAGEWRAGNPPAGGGPRETIDSSEPVPALYNLEKDPDESDNIAKDHPEIVAKITERVEKLIPGFPEEVRNAWSQTKAEWETSAS